MKTFKAKFHKVTEKDLLDSLIPTLTLHYISPHTLTLFFLRLAREYSLDMAFTEWKRPNEKQKDRGYLWLENSKLSICHHNGGNKRLIQLMVRDLVAKFIFYDDIEFERIGNKCLTIMWVKHGKKKGRKTTAVFRHDPNVATSDSGLRFNSLDFDDDHFGTLWKGDSIDGNYDLNMLLAKFAKLNEKLQEAKSNKRGFTFSEDKMSIFLLICESLELTVRSCRNKAQRLCLFIENIKIAEEEEAFEESKFKIQVNLKRIFSQPKKSPRQLIEYFVEVFVEELTSRTHFSFKPKTETDTFSVLRNYEIVL